MSTRRLVAPLLLLALALGGCGIIPPLAPPSPAASKYIPSVAPQPSLNTNDLSADGITTTEKMAVRIRNIGCKNLSTGSGFAIDEHTLITNKHVVADASHVQVQTYDGKDVKVNAASAAAIADLALVRVADALPSFPPLAKSNPAIGDKISVVGYPNGGQLTVTKGEVLRLVHDPLNTNLGNVFLTSANVELGSSGSPALNEAGEVVGVVYAKMKKTSDSYLVPVETLNQILADANGFKTLPKCEPTIPIKP